MKLNKRTLSSLLLALLLMAILTAIVGGCGGDESSSGGNSDTSTSAQSEEGQDGSRNPAELENISISSKAQFVKIANGICRGAEQRIESGVADFEKESGLSVRQLETENGIRQLRRAVFEPVLQEEVEELRALEVPEGDEGQVRRIMAAIERSIGAQAGKPPSSLPEYAARFRPAQELASNYGLASCPVV